jgi:hypothetical protein
MGAKCRLNSARDAQAASKAIRPGTERHRRSANFVFTHEVAPILFAFFGLTRRRYSVNFLPSSNSKERYMKMSAILLAVGVVLCAGGCRHTFEPAPPAYYCQPACGCAPTYNPCVPNANSSLQPVPGSIPPRIPAYSGTAGAAAGTYVPAPGGGYGTPAANPNPSLPAAR